MRILRLSFLLFVSVLVSSCEAEDDARGEPPGSADTTQGTEPTPSVADSDTGLPTETQTSTGSGTANGCTGMDILFVLDDSGSMFEEQENLIANFPKFIGVIEDYETPSGDKVDYRIGVTTTSVRRQYNEKPAGGGAQPAYIPDGKTSDGALLGQVECGFATPWIAGPGSHVEAEFGCVANVGIDGWGTEMHFAAIEDALGVQSEVGGPNAGFYRQGTDTLLVVVVITDEDDCSIEDGGVMAMDAYAKRCYEQGSIGLYEPSHTHAFLDGLAGPGRYVVVSIAGQTKTCDSTFGSAYEAKRLKELVGLSGANGINGDICAGDLWVALEQAGALMKLTCDSLPPLV